MIDEALLLRLRAASGMAQWLIKRSPGAGVFLFVVTSRNEVGDLESMPAYVWTGPYGQRQSAHEAKERPSGVYRQHLQLYRNCKN